ncbi:MAG: dynamin family protein [Chloroflexota bacterium]
MSAINQSGIVLEGPIAELREREVRLLYDAAEYVGKMGGENGASDRQRLLDTALDLREMFLMVVIIGEFNAGKSTFVNALLGDSVLPMGITPTTDAIELVRYAPTKNRRPDLRDGAVREWEHPNTGAPGVVIVDTPGTGSIFQKHEQIAKSFLHRSDLVIFVISAKRAFAETERIYLELAKHYGKKIIVVVNQIDLLEPKEQTEVKSFVQKQIDEMLDLRPPIFMVSAKKALLGDKPSGGMLAALSGNNGKSDFGMDAVRAYLRQTFEQVPPAKQKLLTQLDLVRAVIAPYRQSLQDKMSLIGNDANAAEDLQREMEQQASGLDRQLEATLKEIHAVFEAMQQRGGIFIDKNFNVIRALRRVNKETLWSEFESEVIGNALVQIRNSSEQYANSLVDGSRVYWRSVIERLNKMEALLKAEASNMDAAAYADQRDALQAAMTMADVEMNATSDKKIVENIQTNFEQNIRGFTVSAASGIGGLLALILGHLTPLAPSAYPLAALGVAFGPLVMVAGAAGATLYWRKTVRDAKGKLENQISDLENSYKQSLANLTSRERGRLLQYGKQILSPVFSQLQALAQRYKDQQAQLDTFTDRATGLETEINAVNVKAPVLR